MFPLVIVHLRPPPIQTKLVELAINVRRPSTSHPSSSSYSLVRKLNARYYPTERTRNFMESWKLA